MGSKAKEVAGFDDPTSADASANATNHIRCFNCAFFLLVCGASVRDWPKLVTTRVFDTNEFY